METRNKESNLEQILAGIGTLSALYLGLKIFIPIIENLYLEYGALIIIGVCFIVWWLFQPAKN